MDIDSKISFLCPIFKFCFKDVIFVPNIKICFNLNVIFVSKFKVCFENVTFFQILDFCFKIAILCRSLKICFINVIVVLINKFCFEIINYSTKILILFFKWKFFVWKFLQGLQCFFFVLVTCKSESLASLEIPLIISWQIRSGLFGGGTFDDKFSVITWPPLTILPGRNEFGRTTLKYIFIHTDLYQISFKFHISIFSNFSEHFLFIFLQV